MEAVQPILMQGQYVTNHWNVTYDFFYVVFTMHLLVKLLSDLWYMYGNMLKHNYL
jgi:hypothetical protein